MNKRKAVIAGIGSVAVLVVLVVVVLTKTETRFWGNRSVEKTQTSKEKSLSYDLGVSENKLTSGPGTITVKQGQTIQLNIIVGDQDESEFLVQGYSQGGSLQTGSVAQYAFVANKTGSFPLMIVPEQEDDEPYHPNVQIGTLVVE